MTYLDDFDSDRAIKIMCEVVSGEKPSRPDEPWAAKFRKRITMEIREAQAEAKARGLDFQV